MKMDIDEKVREAKQAEIALSFSMNSIACANSRSSSVIGGDSVA